MRTLIQKYASVYTRLPCPDLIQQNDAVSIFSRTNSKCESDIIEYSKDKRQNKKEHKRKKRRICVYGGIFLNTLSFVFSINLNQINKVVNNAGF